MAIIRKFGGISPKIDSSAFVAETAVVVGDVVIGRESSIWYGSVVRGDVNYIRIGDRTNIQDGAVIHVSKTGFDGPTVIGDEVTVGHAAVIHGCTIERGALIGMNATVLDGAVVGEFSLVAAGSLVTPGTVIPPRSMVMGAPARVKRPLTDAEVDDLEGFWKAYVELLPGYLNEGA
jgi:carbonic anhydrase/acetyltransferase-like protein (isoleucine patch superfamily)